MAHRKATQYTWFSGVSGLQEAWRIVERHCLDVQGTQDRFFVDEVCVVGVRVTSWQYDTHVTHVDVYSSQIGSVQWRPLESQKQRTNSLIR